MARLCIALGANIGPREENLRRAVALLEAEAGPLVGLSALRETAPEGFRSPHRFLNAAAVFETDLSPEQLLTLTQGIERRLGRKEKSTDGTYADRSIDIDLLLLDGTVLRTPSLTLPHPRMETRRFVLEPLAEVAPEAVHPLLGLTVRELLARLNCPRVAAVTEYAPQLLDALNRLLPQLSPSARPLDETALRRLIASPSSRLLVVCDEQGTVCGAATLCHYAAPTGIKAWAEDVVVDSACRHRGYARALLRRLAQEACNAGASSLCLTSRPERRAANALYASFGFQRRETNVYKLPLGGNATESTSEKKDT